jgi:acyl-CoA thioesterase FadM
MGTSREHYQSLDAGIQPPEHTPDKLALEPTALETTTPIRVRYAETDAMGIVHHATYPIWMELGRSDFLRELGQSYSEWEAQGVMMSVGELHLKYRAPAK